MTENVQQAGTARKFAATARVYDDPSGPRPLKVRGQVAKTLVALVRRGDAGMSPFEALDDGCSHRASAYVDVLRDRHGLLVETVRETGNNGTWWGRHILRTRVELVEVVKPEGRHHA